MREVLRNIIEIGNDPTPLFSDNFSAISWAKDNKHQPKRAKHIDVRVHFVRELINRNKVDAAYVASKDKDADLLTKPLGQIKLKMNIGRI